MRCFIALFLVLFFVSCAPGPARQLSETERVADMYWLFSKFDQNYAPRMLKEQNFSFDYEQLKEEYLKEARLEQTNNQFFSLLHRFIAEFKDAHTGGQIQPSSLPGRSHVAYIGFRGLRDGDNLKVTKLLPSIDSKSAYPIKEGDVILKMNGKSLFEVLETEVLPYRNLGQEQANKTALLGSLFMRSSLSTLMPTETSTLLEVKRGSDTFEVEMPWIIKDYTVFMKEQKDALAKKASVSGEEVQTITEEEIPLVTKIIQLIGTRSVSLDYVKEVVGEEKDLNKIFQTLVLNIKPQDIMNTFELPVGNHIWESLDILGVYFSDKKGKDKTKKKTAMEKFKEQRFVPASSHLVPGSQTYPAYLTFRKNKEGVREPVGYIRINTFSPSLSEDKVLVEFQKTLEYLIDFGVKKIALDLLDNGGGSLRLGANLVQKLSSDKLELAKLQFRLNETWVDAFFNMSLNTKSDAEKELARRTYVEIEEARNQGQILSEAYGFDALFPFSNQPNSKLKLEGEEVKFELVLMINELCASMCDIFAGMFQDNKMGVVIGSQSMGAGGNVTNHGQAPNSNMIISQTESLVVRTDEKASYLENNGVIPDITTEVFNERAALFKDTITKALDTLVPPATE